MIYRRKPQTLEFLKRFVLHDRIARIDEAIRAAHATSGYKPKGIIIWGESGAGKTSLIERYKAKYEEAYRQQIPAAETHDRKPILLVEVPAQPDVRSLQMEMLRVLGCPRADRGTRGELGVRIKNYLKALEVELIIIDEFQDLLPSTNKNSPAIIKYIKNTLNQIQIPMILVGLPASQDLLSLGDGQLRGRFSASYELSCFRIDTHEAFEEFRTFLGALQSVLPIEAIDLTEESTALRMYCASQGRPRLISNILEWLIEGHEGDDKATLEDLEMAYDRALRGDATDVDGINFNPFRARMSQVRETVGA